MSKYNRKCDLCNGDMEEEFYEGYVDFTCIDCGNGIRLFYLNVEDDEDDTLLEEY